jgi:hypothetical protein
MGWKANILVGLNLHVDILHIQLVVQGMGQVNHVLGLLQSATSQLAHDE